MRKLFTKVVAVAAAAVMSLGIVSAETILTYKADADNKETQTVDCAGYDSVTIKVTFNEGDASSNGGWGWNSQKAKDAGTGKGADKAWEQPDGWNAADGDFKKTLDKATIDDIIPTEDGKKEVQLQTWWIEEGEGKGYTITVEGVKAAAAPAELSSSSAESSAAESSSAAAESASQTGDATSVAVLAVLAVLALAGVVVTSKKRA